jgi:DNA-binding transcriptional LysR family regulator
MLNLSQLETFVAIVEMKSFRGAAKRLACSQPTISQQLRKLEETLRVTLITRDRARSIPTIEGARLLPLARGLLAAAARAHDVVTGRRLVIGASSNIGTYLLQPYVAKYARIHGGAGAIDLRIATNPEIVDRLSGGELDLAVTEWWDGRQGFSADRWRQEKMVVIVHPDHPWARKKAITPELLFGEPMVGGEAGTGTGTLLKKVFGKKASEIRITMTLGSTEAVKAAVKAGLGVSLVFASAVEDERRIGSLRVLRVSGIDISKQLFVIMPNQTSPDSSSRRFARILMSDTKNRGFPRTNS